MEADRTVLPMTGRIRASCELFAISLLLLFLELACMRWFAAHVLFLTFFTNVVLLACFLGMSVGCLTAGRPRNYLAWTPLLLVAALAGAHGVNWLRIHLHSMFIDVGHQAAPQMVFFGTEPQTQDVARFVIPIEVVNGFFFLIIALAFVGPGQALGRALNVVPNRLWAYTINILGSMAGIVVFGLCSWYELAPLWWFALAVMALSYFLWPYILSGSRVYQTATIVLLMAVPILAALSSRPSSRDGQLAQEHFWSPYYRIDYDHGSRMIGVNLIGHQQMISRQEPSLAYALPHCLNRDAGGTPFRNVLVIGAGSGNDVGRALYWGAEHVDAVEIDPIIQDLGQKYHPDHPYQDPRVEVHLNDGRNFLRTTERQYDLVVYALVDSLVLHSSYSNIRLESYLFTQEAFRDVRRCLKPDGLFVMYNAFRQGWIVNRIQGGLTDVFGSAPLVIPMPYRETLKPDDSLIGEFTVFLAGDTQRLKGHFDRFGSYVLRADRPPAPGDSANGFAQAAAPGDGNWWRFGLTRVTQAAEPLRAANDDWPFLYLRKPMIPDVSLRGMAVMAGLALLVLLPFVPRARGQRGDARLGAHLFFLGAGFMLIETQAVVRMALLFGSTWTVNSIVFFAVLLMILAANIVVLTFKPVRLGPCYLGLLVMLLLNIFVPLDFFLGISRLLQVAGSCLLVCLPVFFAGVLFAVSFARSVEPERALGANIAGAMLGGLAEYCSMLLGFQYLLLVAVAFYAASAVFMRPARAVVAESTPRRQAA
jgi:SAM-dependent methyltransferase